MKAKIVFLLSAVAFVALAMIITPWACEVDRMHKEEREEWWRDCYAHRPDYECQAIRKGMDHGGDVSVIFVPVAQ